MRHALVPVQLIHEARSAGGGEVPERQREDAPPEAPAAPKPQPRRLATLVRRARALVVRTT